MMRETLRRTMHAAIATMVASGLLLSAQPASASCGASGSGNAFSNAKVVFIGVVVAGPYSPAGFIVTRVLKGKPGMFPRVATGLEPPTCDPSGLACVARGSGESISPLPGEQWIV